MARALIRENPEVTGYSAGQLAEYLKTYGPESQKAMEAFMKRHGHRAIREAEIRSRSWHADEVSLCNYLKTVIATGAEEKPKTKMANQNIDAMLSGFHGMLRRVLAYIVGQARRGVVCREFTKSKALRCWIRLKRPTGIWPCC